MPDKNRAKLRPRSNRSLDDMLNQRAANITAQDIADPKSIPEVVGVVEPELENNPTPEPDVETKSEPEDKPTPEPVPATEVDEDDWISGLTPVSATTDLVNNTPDRTPAVEPEPTPLPTTDHVIDQTAEERRLERMRSMTTVDEEVAQEIYNTVLKPELDEIRKAHEQQVSAISGTLTEQQKRQEEFDRDRVEKARATTNEKILSKHPHAGKILQSTEFMAFLKTKEDPYAQQSKYDILNRAYSAGDADYVLRELDAFADTRRKPKPQASVDVNSGGSPNTSSVEKKQPMSQQQYLAERKVIMSRRHKPSDLTELHKRYISSQQ